MTNPQRPQPSTQELQELVTFMAFGAMQMQLMLAAREQQLQQLSDQLAAAKKQQQEQALPAPPLEAIAKVLDYFKTGEAFPDADLEPLRLYVAQALIRQGAAS